MLVSGLNGECTGASPRTDRCRQAWADLALECQFQFNGVVSVWVLFGEIAQALVCESGTPARFGMPYRQVARGCSASKGGAWDSIGDYQLPRERVEDPKPPRTDVLPSRKGSQAKRRRGSKL